YEDRNFSEVNVRYRIEEIAGTNQVRVFFQISEGPRLVVRRINFFGNESVRKRDLIKVMKTRPWNILSFINRSGRLRPAQMEEDRLAIRTLYQN
ncbi:POTRA domain-containing protein, partial [Acetobacter lovaniensis]|uniref:POTRA domain-containing protein n=1 Tax=Acetobacter lovaniensis TaxID=104100 RepID=UPI0037701E72